MLQLFVIKCLFRLWLSMFSSSCVSVCVFGGVCRRQCQSCASNHVAGSDPARSLSGFASFSSQGIFGIVVSDTLIVMGRPGCQWSAWISILLGSVGRASATWCNRSLFFFVVSFLCWLRSRCQLTHQVAYLWAEVERRDLSGPGPCVRVTWAPLPFLSCIQMVALNKSQCCASWDVSGL